MRREADFEWLDHTADIRIRARGEDEGALLESAVLAMSALMVEPPAADDEERDVSLEVAGATPADRLMALLRELLFRFDVEGELPVAARVRLADETVEYRGRAVLFDPDRHVGLREIKAVTWHALDVVERSGGWTADIVFDV